MKIVEMIVFPKPKNIGKSSANAATCVGVFELSQLLRFRKFACKYSGGYKSFKCFPFQINMSLSINVQVHKNDAPESEQFQEGDFVEIVGLKSKPVWNGKSARIIGAFIKTIGRWPIQLTFGDGSKVTVKTRNLKILNSTTLRKSLTNALDDEMKTMEPELKGYRCPKCDAEISIQEASNCFYCKTNTKQSEWESGKQKGTRDSDGNLFVNGTPIWPILQNDQEIKFGSCN